MADVLPDFRLLPETVNTLLVAVAAAAGLSAASRLAAA